MLTSADEAAAWRYRVGRRLVYTLWRSGPPDVRTVVDLACTGRYRPAVALRPVLLAVVASDEATASRVSDAALECAAQRIGARDVEHISDDALLQRHVELRTCAWLAGWISMWGSVAVAETQAQLRAALRGADLERRVRRARANAQRDKQYTLRLCAALHAARHESRAYAAYCAELLALIGHTDVAAGWTGGEHSLGETCAACGGLVPFTVPYSRCAAGHVFWRCTATWSLITDVDTLTCSGCGAQASRPALQASGEPNECMSCGHQWVAP